MKQHTFITFLDDDTPIRVRYTHSKAEPMTLEYPGRDAEVVVDEVSVGIVHTKWEPVETYPQLNVDRLIEEAWDDVELREELRSYA